MSKKDGLYLAKGHVAKIVQFDEETILLPLRGSEVSRLLSAIGRSIRELKATNDFPEEKEYEDLRYNLQTALMYAK